MDQSETTIWLTLKELQARLDKIAQGSGDDFLKRLQQALSEQTTLCSDPNKMAFMLIKATFAETFAGLAGYYYVVNIRCETQVYRATLRQHQPMAVTALPEAVTDIMWLSLTELQDLLNTIALHSGDKLPIRLKQALPEQVASYIDNGEMQFMLINAALSGMNHYCYEIKIQGTTPAYNTTLSQDLGMEVTEFAFKLWQGDRV